MQFADVIGQEKAKNNLRQAVEKNKLAHGLLIIGRDGQGGLSLGLAFLQWFFCERRMGNNVNENALFEPEVIDKNLDDSCGKCANCIKVSKGIHPDIHFSFPVITKKSGEKPTSNDYITEFREFIINTPYNNLYDWLQFIKAENKQGNITSAECESIIKKLSLKSFEGGYKVLLMWMPEQMGKEGNKLLKLIEEPPSDTLLLFIAENEENILPTILSRLQSLRLNTLSNNEMENSLMKTKGATEQSVKNIVVASEGNYRTALQSLEHTDENWDLYTKNWLNALLRLGPQAQLAWIEEISKLGREKQKQFLRYLLVLISIAFKYKIGFVSESETGVNELAEKLSKIIDIEQIEVLSDITNQTIFQIERNALAKITFHAFTIKWYHIIKNNSVILL